MGFAVEPDRRDGGQAMVPRRWVEQNDYIPERLLAMEVKGESMEPALYAGDLVIVNTADTRPVDGAVYAINYEGEPVIKRLVRDGGFWWLASDHSDQRKYSRKRCEGDMCIIVGRVVRKESERI
jgi:phage repressor protein C with HTH and peptisase S24 domain